MLSIISLQALFNQFWERAIPKADRAQLIPTVGFKSNHVTQELKHLSGSGTPFGYPEGSRSCRSERGPEIMKTRHVVTNLFVT